MCTALGCLCAAARSQSDSISAPLKQAHRPPVHSVSCSFTAACVQCWAHTTADRRMARLRSAAKEPAAITPAYQPETSGEKPEKINLEDAHAIKHKLDSTVVDVVTHSDYQEDHLVSNVKITLGLLAIACALYAQFGPGKFPANWDSVYYCVVAYVILTVVLNIFCFFKEGDSFLITHPKLGHEYGIRVSSRMDRFSDIYTLRISSADKFQDREVQQEASVTDYFHEDGYLADAKWRSHVSKLLLEYKRMDAASAPRPFALNPKKQQ